VYAAAVELFVSRGFDSTTMEEIADRADVARATVFNHFQRKTAILEEWSARRRQQALAAVHSEHLERSSVREILERYMVELACVSTSSRAETVALMGAALHATNLFSDPALAHELASFLARARIAGELPEHVDPELAGLLVATGYFVTLTRWINVEPEPFDLQDELHRVLALILDGVLPSRPG